MQREESTIGDQIAQMLTQIASLFEDDVVLTLVCRSLNSPDGSRDNMVSNDPDYEALIDAFKRLWRERPSPEVAQAVKRELQ